MTFPAGSREFGLQVFDRQSGQPVSWVEQVFVYDFAWSPQGTYLAVLACDDGQQELQIYDRWGHMVRKTDFTALATELRAVSWAPRGTMLALELSTCTGPSVVVTHLEAETRLLVAQGLAGSEATWIDDELYFTHEGHWYATRSPEVKPVTLSSPVPQVLQRRRILSPTIVKEGNTIRLTRPSLTMP